MESRYSQLPTPLMQAPPRQVDASCLEPSSLCQHQDTLKSSVKQQSHVPPKKLLLNHLKLLQLRKDTNSQTQTTPMIQ